MTVIVLLQVLLAIPLSLSILLQHRAAGLSATFGGSDTSFVQRRGAELFLYKAAIVQAVLFFALTIIDWYV